MKMILINGKKRAGKDYLARELKRLLEEEDKSVEIMSFAEPLKHILADTLNISFDELEEFKNDESTYELLVSKDDEITHAYSFRRLLQALGTDAMKKWFGDDVWVKLLMQRVKSVDSDFVIVPDFRFLSENLFNSFKINIFDDDLLSTDTHSSENELNDFVFDYKVNNTDYSNLIKQSSDIVKLLLQEHSMRRSQP